MWTAMVRGRCGAVRLLLAAAMATASASASWVVVHEPTVIPPEWMEADTPLAAEDAVQEVFDVTVGLKRSNATALVRLSQQVSEPMSEKYLQYPTFEEMGNLVRPPPERTAVVEQWLKDHGVEVTRRHPHGDYIHFRASAITLERMAGGQFIAYAHVAGGKPIHRMTGGVRVPGTVAAAIDVFTGFNGFPAPRVRVRTGAGPTPGKITPALIRKTYGVDMDMVPESGRFNIQAFAQFSDGVNATVLSSFCREHDPVSSTCNISRYLANPNNNYSMSIESALDSEYLVTMGHPTPTWVYSFPPTEMCAAFLALSSNATSDPTHPWVLSVSYGSQLNGFCTTAVRERFQQDAVKMGTMGFTLIFSSGDSGSGQQPEHQPPADQFLSPSFPASVPNCLAVGSTYFVDRVLLSGEEQATTHFGSGGGFSYNFDVPTYQAEAVAEYLKVVPDKPTQKFGSGRGTPDVSALGWSFLVMVDSYTTSVGGTSASAPTVGGIISLLNEICLTHAGRPLGFVNPLFYQNPHMFTDVTKGTNAIHMTQGWAATKGWDAATGLGVPDFPSMVDVVRKACTKAGKQAGRV